MNDCAVIAPGRRSGMAAVPSSKSVLHRLFISAALSGYGAEKSKKGYTTIFFRGVPDDILATADCLEALGAGVVFAPDGLSAEITPVRQDAAGRTGIMPCRESGSTLRFLLPLAAALGADAVFNLEGRLSERPIEALAAELGRHGASVEKNGKTVCVSGKLKGGSYTLPGDVSSQFVTGLLFALPLLSSDSVLEVRGRIQSAGYIKMTEDVLRQSGIRFERDGGTYSVPGMQTYRLPDGIRAEGDWSGASYFLCLGALSDGGVSVGGLDTASSQGDRRLTDILESMGAGISLNGCAVTVRRRSLRGIEVDASDIPDIIPSIAAIAAFADGTTVIRNAERLRAKESDRLETTFRLLTGIGADAVRTSDSLIIRGKKNLPGGKVSSCGDHRIAMAAAVAAAGCDGPVLLEGAGCVRKSFPDFWEQFNSLEVSK